MAMMIQVVDAVYANGVFKPAKPLDLPENQLVRLTVEVVEPRTEADREAARQQLIEGLKRSTFRLTGKLPSRDELHERDR